MGVGITYLRKKEDKTWEGDYYSSGYETFDKFCTQIFSLKEDKLYFISFREDEYEIENDSCRRPYSAQVSESLAKEMDEWYKDVGLKLLEDLHKIPNNFDDQCVQSLKSNVENHLENGYVFVVSF